MSLTITIRGTGGQIKVPGLGAVLATVESWTLRGLGRNRDERQLFDLNGYLSYVNETLYRQLLANGYPMQISLTGRDKMFEVELGETPADLSDLRLIAKEITLHER